ncbi:MAG: methyltransferase domain-containing protein [Chromatiales bacterium]|jgi:S-adenosylmethionine-dependent methyltransferase
MDDNDDRNFDALFDRFAERIYDTDKGAWRLKLLQEDLQFLHDATGLDVWDAGCGFAQISAWLAAAGHRLTLCDVSQKMLARAQQDFAEAGLSGEFFRQPAQQLAARLPQFDLLLCHAVLEWLGQPLPTLTLLLDKVKPGGYLSLLFYNRNAMVYSNVLKGGWRLKFLLDDSYLGKGNKLTPPNPQYPHEVLHLLQQNGFSVKKHTGVRVFHDYLDQPAMQQTELQELFELEYRYCRLPTYRDMGRYVHLLAQKDS